MHDGGFERDSFRDVNMLSFEHLAFLRSREDGFERVAKFELFLVVFEEVWRFVCSRTASVI